MCINARRNDGQYGRSATGLPQAFRLQIPPQRRAAYSQHFGGDLPAATRPGQGFIERAIQVEVTAIAYLPAGV